MYRLYLKRYKDFNTPYPDVKHTFIKENKIYFNTVEGEGLVSFKNIVENTPLFDYFNLWTENNQNDWILLDAYYLNNSIAIYGFYVSEKLMRLLQVANKATPYKFYPSKLKFKEKKLDYYIFQMAWDEWSEYDFKKSIYFEKINNEWVKLDIEITNSKEFRKIYKLWDADNEKYKLKIVLKKKYDIFYFQYIGFVISEELKTKIEAEKITGLEISTYKNIEFEFKV